MIETYAGIGPREVPTWVEQFCELAGEALAWKGYRLRSGHAAGCDEAFERGAYADGMISPESEIYLPWPTFRHDEAPNVLGIVHERPTNASYEMVREFHPSWAIYKRGVKALMARNAHILLGPELNQPVKFVLTWTEDGTVDGEGKQGGTAATLRMASAWNIPVFNYAVTEHERRIDALLEEYLTAQTAG